MGGRVGAMDAVVVRVACGVRAQVCLRQTAFWEETSFIGDVDLAPGGMRS